MMRLNRYLPVFGAVFSLLAVNFSVFAQANPDRPTARNFGIGSPFAIEELPDGRFKNQLLALPADARSRALGKMQEISFPVADSLYLRASRDGSIWYEDAAMMGPEESGGSTVEAYTLGIPPDDVFKLHSRPGSSNVLYLDFDGEYLAGTAWNPSGVVLELLPFDPSNNDSDPMVAEFTDDELARIFEIWHRVSEDFARFDIDVTTEEPAVFTNTTGRVMFTHYVDATGRTLQGSGATGIARVGYFGHPDYAYYSPVFVYYTNLSISAPGEPTYNAELASHEFGHNLGLTHDGTTIGDTYYFGHGEGNVDWAPIMGASYKRDVTTWSKGEYAYANNTQDDIAIIANRLGFIADDHGEGIANATPLVVEPDGDILVSSPEVDPDNLLPENKGVIDDRNDTDWFSLVLAEDNMLQLTVTPAWHAFQRDGKRGANLDIELTLIDAGSNILQVVNPEDDTAAQLSAALTAGTYYLQVDGVGNHANTDYTDYASQGMYFIEGTVTTGELDFTAPAPNTMSWAAPPTAVSAYSVSMEAIIATDDSGVVEYNFTCVAGDAACGDSGWQAGNRYELGGLSPDTYYAFKVTARDAFGNQTEASQTRGTTTFALPANQAPVASAQFDPSTAVIAKGNSATVAFDGSGSHDPDGSIVSWVWTDGAGQVVSETARFSLTLKSGTHVLMLTVTDDDGAKASATVSVDVAKSTDGDGGGGTGNPGKGKKPKG